MEYGRPARGIKGQAATRLTHPLNVRSLAPHLAPHRLGQRRYSLFNLVRDFGSPLHGIFGELSSVFGPLVDRLPGSIKSLAQIFPHLLARFGGKQHAEQSSRAQSDQQKGDRSPGGASAI